MIAEIKLFVLPLAAGFVLIADIYNEIPTQVRTVVDIAALAVLLAGFLVVGKLRAEATASKGAAEAWREERDAAESKAERLAAEIAERDATIADLRVAVKELEARPTLDQMQTQLESLSSLMSQTATAVQEVIARGVPQTEPGT